MPNHWEEMSELSLNRADFVQTSQKKRSNTCNYKACYIPPSWKKKDKKCAIIYTVGKELLHYAWEPMSSA